MSLKSYIADIEQRLIMCGIISYIATEKAKSFRGLYVNETTYIDPKKIVSNILNKMDSDFFTPMQQEFILDNYGGMINWNLDTK